MISEGCVALRANNECVIFFIINLLQVKENRSFNVIYFY